MSTASTAMITSRMPTAVSAPKCMPAITVPRPTSTMPDIPGNPNPGRKTSTTMSPIPSSRQSTMGRFAISISTMKYPLHDLFHDIPHDMIQAYHRQDRKESHFVSIVHFGVQKHRLFPAQVLRQCTNVLLISRRERTIVKQARRMIQCKKGQTRFSRRHHASMRNADGHPAVCHGFKPVSYTHLFQCLSVF